jgi:protein-tyrosine phosphatase
VQLAPADLESAHLVVALKEAEHRPLLAKRYPGWEGRVTYWHVHDVDCAEVPETLAAIEQLIADLTDRLAAGQSG